MSPPHVSSDIPLLFDRFSQSSPRIACLTPRIVALNALIVLQIRESQMHLLLFSLYSWATDAIS